MNWIAPRLFFFYLILLYSNVVLGQCTVALSAQIPDNYVTQFSVKISGAVNNNLATSAQGVCGVRIHFNHPGLGDLAMRLHSPAGQVVNLIGPSGGSSNTAGTTWDVTFVPCNSTPNPDIGILPTWSNNSNWLPNSQYFGQYFPVGGSCLESFNTGPVNGVWTLEITDGSTLDIGNLLSFSLLFCEPSGIQCYNAYKNAGVLPSTIITACEGDILLNSSIVPTFPFGTNGANTGYVFLISNFAGFIVGMAPNIDLRTYPSGQYTVCGFAYDSNDSALLPPTDGSVSMSAFRALYWNGAPSLAGDITRQCVTVNVVPHTPVQIINRFICGNGPIFFEGDTISMIGIYNYTFTNQFGCDSIRSYLVQPVIFNPALSVSNTLTCTTPNAIITSNHTSFPPGTRYSWFTNNGEITSTTNTHEITVSFPGVYHLALENQGCRDTVSITVTQDNTLPVLTVTSTHLDCNTPQSNVVATATGSGITFEWTGPGGFTATVPNPVVSVAGTYIVTATNFLGCAISKSIVVTDNFQRPRFFINSATKFCEYDTLTLTINPQTSLMSTYSWMHPDGSITAGTSVTSSLNGKYIVSAIGNNGCTYTDSVNVVFSNANPKLTSTNSIINCYNPMINLPVTASGPAATYQWTGPGGFTSTLLNPEINTAGWYFLTATSTAGCVSRDSLRITSDFVYPTLNLPDPVFACRQESMIINPTFTPPDASFNWTGEGLFTASIPNPEIYESGEYFVTVTAANGCTVLDTLNVRLNPLSPRIETAYDSLTCYKATALLEVAVLTGNPTSIDWEGPGGFTATGNPVAVSGPGKYWVKVTDGNGCFTKKSAWIFDFTSPPEVVLFQDSINCIRDTAVIGFIPFPTLDQFYWVLPNNDTITNQQQLVVNNLDTFRLHLLNFYGCTLDTFVHVAVDNSVAQLTSSVLPLTCARTQVTLSVTSSKPVVSYDWLYPDGSQHTQARPVVDKPGTYRVMVTTQNGCVVSHDILVLIDTVPPEVTITDGTFSCKDKFFVLDYITDQSNYMLEWHGPGNFVSTNLHPQVTATGQYILILTGANGCVTIDTAEITLSDVLPDLLMPDDTINCWFYPKPLTPITNAHAPIFSWTIPGNQKITGDTLYAGAPGTYYLEMIDSFECVVLDTFVLSIDTMPPALSIYNTFYLDCNNDTLLLELPWDDIHSFNWQLDTASISQDSFLIVQNQGHYTLEAIGTNGCSFNAAFEVITDYIIPDLSVAGGELNCRDKKINLIASSTVGSVAYRWDDYGVIKTGNTLFVDTPGLYHVEITAPNGCKNDTTVEVNINITPPDLFAPDGSLSCDSTAFLLQAFTTSDVESFGWFSTSGFMDDTSSIMVFDTGHYYIFLRGVNGCLSVDTVLVDDNPPHPVFTLTSDTITCYTPQVPVIVHATDSLEKFEWTGPGNFTSQSRDLMVGLDGEYELTAYGDNGCPTTVTVWVSIDTLSPMVFITTLDSILCSHRVIELIGNQAPPGEHYSYNWHTITGEIISDPTDTIVFIKDIGLYALTETNLRNGCASTAVLDIDEKPNRLYTILSTIKLADCVGINNGAITIDGVPFAIGELQYSLIEGYFYNNNYWNKLAPDDYFITVKDSYGCTFDTVISVGVEQPIEVNLGNDTTIILGQNVTIDPEFSIDENYIAHYYWTNVPNICIGCPWFEDRPFQTTTYFLQAVTSNGCIGTDEITVTVVGDNNVFVPNAFTPNGDGNNDVLYYYATNNVSEILEFRIFDRWGNVVYSVDNRSPFDTSLGWDGTFHNALMNPAVFVYFIRYRLIDGTIITNKGNITLIR